MVGAPVGKPPGIILFLGAVCLISTPVAVAYSYQEQLSIVLTAALVVSTVPAFLGGLLVFRKRRSGIGWFALGWLMTAFAPTVSPEVRIYTAPDVEIPFVLSVGVILVACSLFCPECRAYFSSRE